MNKIFKFSDNTQIIAKVKKSYKDYSSGLPDVVLNYLIENPKVRLVK